MGLARFSFASERAKARIERVMLALKKERLTVAELAERIHCDKSGINPYVMHLHGTPKRIHIAEWDTSGFRAVARYAAGNKPDAPKPMKSKAQYWQEVKADPERLARDYARQARYRRAKSGRDYLLRECKRYDPPLKDQVRQQIDAWPGSTSRQIAERIDATLGAVKHAALDLSRAGVIKSEKRTRAGSHWEMANRQKVKHAPFVTRPQGIFAALWV